jgi:NADH-quinone oxidoreductase subunit C
VGILEIVEILKSLKEGKKFEEKEDAYVIYTERELSLSLLKRLKELGFCYLVDLCGVDYLNYKPEKRPFRFEVVYHLYSFEHKVLVRVRVGIPEDDAWQYSVSHLWSSANWFERECFDMFGIKFVGHPELKRVFMPEDWQGHPLRKDYPLFIEGEHEWETYKELVERHQGKRGDATAH